MLPFAGRYIQRVVTCHDQRHVRVSTDSEFVLVIIIICLTDFSAATALAYEKPQANLILRLLRNAKTDKLVNWRLLFEAWFGDGLIKAITSFFMAF